LEVSNTGKAFNINSPFGCGTVNLSAWICSKSKNKLYIKSLLANGDDLFNPPRIKVSTIHGVKGEECDNVVLFTDLERVIYESARKNPNPEHRLFFVGVTRAKENLYIMQPDIDDYYNYIPGDPIL